MRKAAPSLIALAFALSACKRAPRGPCAADLGGVWVNASDSRFGYRLTDRGDEVAGEAFLREPSGKPMPPDPTSPPVTFKLRRAGEGLEGILRSPAVSLGGKDCLVEFSMKMGSCSEGKVQVTSEMSAPFDDTCARLHRLPDGGTIAPDLAEFVWVRP